MGAGAEGAASAASVAVGSASLSTRKKSEDWNCSREDHVQGDVRRREKEVRRDARGRLVRAGRSNYDALGDAIMREAEATESIAPARREIASRRHTHFGATA